MTVYSFSQIQTYLQCPLSYKFRYLDKIKPEFEENLHLILWTTVHSTLEYLYQKINNFYIPSEKELKDYFLNIYKEKIQKLEDKELDEQKEEFKTRWLVYLEQYYKKHYPFDNIKVIWTEMQLYIDLEDSIKFQWFVDRLDKKGDSFIITDYKTNKQLPEQDKDYYMEQLTLYALWVKQKYWKYFNKIYWNLEYLHFDYQDFWEIKDDNIKKNSEKYKKIALEIETKKAEHWLWMEDVFKPIESSLCRFCDYKEICPLFAHFYWELSDEDFSKDTIKNMIDEYIDLNEQKKDIDDKMKKYKEILQSFSKKHNLKRLYWKWWYISLSKMINYSIKDKDKLKEYLNKTNQLEKFMDIDKTKITRAIKESKLKMNDLKYMIQEKETIIFRSKKE